MNINDHAYGFVKKRHKTLTLYLCLQVWLCYPLFFFSDGRSWSSWRSFQHSAHSSSAVVASDTAQAFFPSRFLWLIYIASGVEKRHVDTDNVYKPRWCRSWNLRIRYFTPCGSAPSVSLVPHLASEIIISFQWLLSSCLFGCSIRVIKRWSLWEKHWRMFGSRKMVL